MSKQLILFPPGTFDKIRADEGPAYIRRLEEKVRKLELSVRSLKGHFTKKKKKEEQSS